MTTPQPAALPELPDVPPIRFSTGLSVEWAKMYTAEQMRAYALAALQSQPAARNITAELSLMVLCAVKDLPGLHANILKDIESAIEANRAAAQPAAAGVSDAEIRDALEAEFLGEAPNRVWADDLRIARAILALRPQAGPKKSRVEIALETTLDRYNERHGITAPAGGEG